MIINQLNLFNNNQIFYLKTSDLNFASHRHLQLEIQFLERYYLSLKGLYKLSKGIFNTL